MMQTEEFFVGVIYRSAAVTQKLTDQTQSMLWVSSHVGEA